MEDRELLELAGKAAGIDVQFLPAWGGGTACYGDGHYWNPLTNDTDALRLAVAMCLPLDITDEVTEVTTLGISEGHGSDPFAATRRAIVLAAAEIWRAQQ